MDDFHVRVKKTKKRLQKKKYSKPIIFLNFYWRFVICKKQLKCSNTYAFCYTINACEAGFKELEKFGFKFGAFGFGGTHVHTAVNVPERYSVLNAKTMLKTWSAKRIFAEKPGFRKLYPRGSFWSGYEHHHGFGLDQVKALNYVNNQPQHHNISIIEDV